MGLKAIIHRKRNKKSLLNDHLLMQKVSSKLTQKKCLQCIPGVISQIWGLSKQYQLQAHKKRTPSEDCQGQWEAYTRFLSVATLVLLSTSLILVSVNTEDKAEHAVRNQDHNIMFHNRNVLCKKQYYSCDAPFYVEILDILKH